MMLFQNWLNDMAKIVHYSTKIKLGEKHEQKFTSKIINGDRT